MGIRVRRCLKEPAPPGWVHITFQGTRIRVPYFLYLDVVPRTTKEWGEAIITHLARKTTEIEWYNTFHEDGQKEWAYCYGYVPQPYDSSQEVSRVRAVGERIWHEECLAAQEMRRLFGSLIEVLEYLPTTKDY